MYPEIFFDTLILACQLLIIPLITTYLSLIVKSITLVSHLYIPSDSTPRGRQNAYIGRGAVRAALGITAKHLLRECGTNPARKEQSGLSLLLSFLVDERMVHARLFRAKTRVVNRKPIKQWTKNQ